MQAILTEIYLSSNEIENVTKAQDVHNRRTFTLAIISLIVSGLLGIGNVGFQVWRDHSNQKSNEIRFTGIQTSLRLLTATVAPQLQKAVDDSLASALVKPSQAKDKVVFAGSIIEQLNQSSIPLPSEEVVKTGMQLSDLTIASHEIPEVWETAGKFINYRSKMVTGWENSNLPPCSETNLKIKELDVKDSIITVKHGPAELNYCKIILDSPEATALLSPALGLADVVCNHCMIFYSGGPIVLIPQKVTADLPPFLLGNVLFKDCTFAFSLKGTPPGSGQKLTQDLLTATTNSVRLDAATRS
jgi:hypothetical protein